MNEVKQYAERDLMEMDRAGNHYCRHVDHMTREKLHSKSDIAAELGWRDMQIANLKEQLTATTNSLTNAQEALKSAGIEADTVQAGVMELTQKITQERIYVRDLNGSVHEWKQRAEAAEAKLAELERQEPIGRVDRGEANDNNEYPGVRVVCLHEQADWINFQDGTELFLRPAPGVDLNAVRAEGVEMFATFQKKMAAQHDADNRTVWADERRISAEQATGFAGQLRAGNAGKDGV